MTNIQQKVAQELWRTGALGSFEDCEILSETLYDAGLLAHDTNHELKWEHRERNADPMTRKKSNTWLTMELEFMNAD